MSTLKLYRTELEAVFSVVTVIGMASLFGWFVYSAIALLARISG